MFIYYRVAFEIRWDQLAFLAWGNSYMLDTLLEANQDIGVYNWLPVGAIISVPIDLNSGIISNSVLLPAWKQDN